MWGRYWLTENKATIFPNFWKKKVLAGNESVDDYKEVTDNQKTSMEKARDEWKRPEQSFIDEWNNACINPFDKKPVGKYNEETGYFECNGLVDITYKQAMDIYRFTSMASKAVRDSKDNICSGLANFRTNLPPTAEDVWVLMFKKFTSNSLLEVVRLPQYYQDGVRFSQNSTRQTFLGCGKLREIINVIIVPQVKSNLENWYSTFNGCYSLETVWLKSIYDTISFIHSPLIRLECLEYLVENRTTLHNDNITITLHPDAYARLTDELIAKATDKNVTFETTT